MILLETMRLRLRRFTDGDIERLVELDSDPEVMRYITYGEPTAREEYESEILPRWFSIYAATPLLGYWAAEDRESGDFMVIDDRDLPEEVWAVPRSYWRSYPVTRPNPSSCGSIA